MNENQAIIDLDKAKQITLIYQAYSNLSDEVEVIVILFAYCIN